ncbi:unnamed protein product, partial [Discosporangium mesarthrocarpum]
EGQEVQESGVESYLPSAKQHGLGQGTVQEQGLGSGAEVETRPSQKRRRGRGGGPTNRTPSGAQPEHLLEHGGEEHSVGPAGEEIEPNLGRPKPRYPMRSRRQVELISAPAFGSWGGAAAGAGGNQGKSSGDSSKGVQGSAASADSSSRLRSSGEGEDMPPSSSVKQEALPELDSTALGEAQATTEDLGANGKDG